jgi:ABC-type uncharacterized transport system substrate-binding protein
MMKRRQFITLLSGAAAAWPLAARAQQPERMRRIGVLVPLPAIVWAPFFDELRQQGFVEGQNFAVDRRGFDARYEQFSMIVAAFENAGPDAILCGGDAAIRAVQAARMNIPIVAITDDMVGAGLVRSLARPGGNTTGVSILAADLDAKRQEVLLEFIPDARRLAVLSDGQNNTPAQLEVLLNAARARDIKITIHQVERKENIGAAIPTSPTQAMPPRSLASAPLATTGYASQSHLCP